MFLLKIKPTVDFVLYFMFLKLIEIMCINFRNLLINILKCTRTIGQRRELQNYLYAHKK